jgi:hypothetical protein
MALSASAQAQSKFGGQGQLVVSDDQPLGIISSFGLVDPLPPNSTSAASFQFATLTQNGGSGTSFVLSPAADYFVIPNLSLGAELLVGFLSPAHPNGTNGVTDTVLGIAPRIGYNIPLSDNVSFWPKLFFGYTSISGSNNSGGANSVVLGVFAPFLFHVAPHFFLGIGPNLSTQLSNNRTQGNASIGAPEATVLGLQATFGGYFLGD